MHRHQWVLVVQSSYSDRDGLGDYHTPNLAIASHSNEYQKEDSDHFDVLYWLPVSFLIRFACYG